MTSTDSIAIKKILATAAEYGASDLHLSPGNPPILRIDGKLTPLETEPIITPDFMTAVVELLLTPEQRTVLELEKEIVTAVNLDNRSRFKISLFHEKGVLAASLRLVPTQIKSIRELGLPPVVERFADLTDGLVLVTGPFGSGRTATMAAIVNAINQHRTAHIVTIEQPIEFLFTNSQSIIEQREVGPDTRSFEQALATAAREDVDVIMVSEMEEPKVVRAVLAVAETNRLVISTMNTDSVLKTIEKIISSYPPEEEIQARRLVAETLQGIVSQRLLPRVGGGRIVVAEIMVPTDPVRSVIRDGAIYQLASILQTSREEGMVSFDRYLAELVKTGEIAMADALTHAHDRRHVSLMAQA